MIIIFPIIRLKKYIIGKHDKDHSLKFSVKIVFVLQ
nr:MAG TPA: hypothetical protein [Caudoviricetes sp.]